MANHFAILDRFEPQNGFVSSSKTISSLQNHFEFKLVLQKKQFNLRFCTVWQTSSRIKLVTRELGWGGVKCPQWGELDVLVLSLVAL